MSDLNRCEFIGRCGQDPEIRYTADGKAVASLSLACGEKWKDKQGNKQEKTEWIKVTAFGRLAEIISEYLKKGSQVYISGKWRTNKWQDKEGNDRYTTEILANEMQMLGGKSGQAPNADGGQRKQSPNGGKEPTFDDWDSEIPF